MIRALRGSSVRLGARFAAASQSLRRAAPRSSIRSQHTVALDGNRTAAYVAFALTDVGMGYPITPASEGFEQYEKWANEEGKKNAFGNVPSCWMMQSEAGVSGSLHGTLVSGSLASTFTSSQGLLLMIPNLYRMSTEKLPGVLHVSCRQVGRSNFGIFADHSDVMATRQAGWGMLASSSVQEVHDLGIAAHLAAMEAAHPFMHFFEGMRLSHAYTKLECLEYDEIAPLIPMDAVRAHRMRALNPEHPCARGSVNNDDELFAWQEAAHVTYDKLPGIVEGAIDKVAAVTGRHYKLFDYYGDPEAEDVVVLMGSASEAAIETVNHLNKMGEKVGVIKVRLYRPFSGERFLNAIPKSAKRVCVLDRTREFGAPAEPLGLDCTWTMREAGDERKIVHGVYGIHGKDPTPAMFKSVFDNMRSDTPVQNFTVGIEDDVRHKSLVVPPAMDTSPAGQQNCVFWGRGGDGTVGVNQEAINIIGLQTENYAQGYFFFEAKKTGGWTQSHLRFGPEKITSQYNVTHADFVALHAPAFIKNYPILDPLKEGAIFLLNTHGKSAEEFEKLLPSHVKHILAKRNIQFYAIDALNLSEEVGLKGRVNIAMQSAFLKLTEIVEPAQAQTLLEEFIQRKYGKQGERVVNANIEMAKLAVERLTKIDVPKEWAELSPVRENFRYDMFPEADEVLKKLYFPAMNLEAAKIPVSGWEMVPDSRTPTGTTKYEKRDVATEIPIWDPTKCTQCNECSLVCPHACIRPFLLDAKAKKASSKGVQDLLLKSRDLKKGFFTIGISPFDCMSCRMCANHCSDGALTMTAIKGLEEVKAEMNENWLELISKPNRFTALKKRDQKTVKGVQYKTPLVEFPPSCAGCSQTKVYTMLSRLLGDRMTVANASGCSCVWTDYFPSCSVTTNQDGEGPAYGCSLFEDNAEYGYGMARSYLTRRNNFAGVVERALADSTTPAELKPLLEKWQGVWMEGAKSKAAGKAVKAWFAEDASRADVNTEVNEISHNLDLLTKPSHWAVGGDGWAYDIGYGGVDHVMSRDVDINILIFDNESYANTGFQLSKATPHGASVKFAASGNTGHKKNLGLIALSYGNAYVASLSQGADPKHMMQCFEEADAFPGPAVVMVYAPCVGHGVDMSTTHDLERQAVVSGYWPVYKYDPRLKDPLVIEEIYGSEPETLDAFLDAQVRFAGVARKYPEQAKVMRASLKDDLADLRRKLGGYSQPPQ